MHDPKVSVCMVAYNQERFIAQAIESILAQKVNFPIEIVIGEDCSTDNTAAIIRDLVAKAPGVIRPRFAEQNCGAKENFLSTIPTCRGEYVAMLEGDDYWTCDDKLQLQVDALDAHPEWAICFHPTACVYEDGMQGQSFYPLNWTQDEATLEDLLSANFIPTNAVVFRNNLRGQFPPWFRELKLGDWPMHILNAAYGNIGFLPQVMSAYRVHRNGIWNGETPSARIAAIFKMFTAIDHHFAGRFTPGIEQYRLNAVGGLMAEVEAANRYRGDLQSQLEQDRAHLAALNNTHDQLSNKYISLRSEFEMLKELLERASTLREFYDFWASSIYCRAVLKTRRLIAKARSHGERKRLRKSKLAQDGSSSNSKAA
jgi:glycosyltransferase involved in cell wall biosynthesis